MKRLQMIKTLNLVTLRLSFAPFKLVYSSAQWAKSLIIAVAASLLLSSCGQASDAGPISRKGLILTVNLDPIARNTGKVVLKSTLTNQGDEPIEFLPWNSLFDSALTGHFLSIVDMAAKEALTYQGPFIKRRPPIASDYVTLDPSGLLSNELDISAGYNFCANRQYTLKFIGLLYDRDSNALPLESKSVELKLGDAFKAC